MKLNIQRFATLMKKTKSTVGSPYCYYVIECTNVSNRQLNTVDVTIKVTSNLAASSSSLGTGQSMGINAIFKFNGGADQSLALKASNVSWSGTATHTAEKTFTVSGLSVDQTSVPVAVRVSRTGTAAENYSKYGCVLSNRNISSISIPNSVVPSEINSVTSGTTNYAPIVKFTPCESSLTFKVKYSYGSWSYTSGLISPNRITEYTYNSYTINGNTVRGYMPNASATFTATLYTYLSDGSTLIGTKNKNFTVTLNASHKPNVSISNITDVGNIVPSSWGVYVQNKSKLKFTITGTPDPGSSIKGYYNKVEGHNYNTSTVSTNYTDKSGNIESYVKDSRGRTSNTLKTAYTVVPYTAPHITEFNAIRCNADGSNNNEGTSVKYTFKCNVSDCDNHNEISYQLGYKTKSASNYTYINISNNSENVVIPNVTFSIDTVYDIIFKVTDSFGYDTASVVIQTGFLFLHFNKNKKALAIGRYSSASGNDTLCEIAMPTKIYNNLNINGRLTISQNNKNFYIDASDNDNDTYYRTDANRHYFNKDIVASSNVKANNGKLVSTCNGKTITIGSNNASYCHYETDAPSHYFNKEVRVNGNVYGGSNYNRRLAYIDEVHPTGSCFTTTTNTNPNNLGILGTWVLIDKVFVNQSTSESNFIADGGQTNGVNAYWSRCGHTLNLQLDFTNKVRIDDNTHHIGRWNVSALGVTGLPHVTSITGYTDGGNCCVMMDCKMNGDVYTYDVIPDSYVSEGKYICVFESLTIPMDNMLDSACNQFIWKRTA